MFYLLEQSHTFLKFFVASYTNCNAKSDQAKNLIFELLDQNLMYWYYIFYSKLLHYPPQLLKWLYKYRENISTIPFL